MAKARPAVTADDRRAAAVVTHAAHASPLPVDAFVAMRLRNPRRATATWWLLEEAGVVVASLVAYPLTFAVGDAVAAGYGLGAVATLPEARRRGHATALCRDAIEATEAEGRRVGLLFSAIPPAFYARLGFQVVPAWHHVCARPAELAASGPRVPWTPIDPRAEAETLANLHARRHGGALHLHRDVAGFLRSVDLNPEDLFFGVGTPRRGYVRVAVEAESVEVVEEVLPAPERAAALRAVGRLAVGLKALTVEGWFDPCPTVAEFFDDRGRATTLPMVRGCSDLARARFSSADYF
jgi:predicted N-acetyltransferase YhbS